MINQSIWLAEAKNFHFESLKKDVETDILIIGGGISGISLLYELMDTKLNVMLVERNEIGGGVTSKTTAKLNYLQGIVYSKIKNDVSSESAKLYLNSQREGMKKIIDTIKKEKIDCNLKCVTSFLYGKEKDAKDMEKEYEFLKENNVEVTKEKNSLSVKDTYVFHPLKYLYALANICKNNNAQIYENTLITDLKRKGKFYICNSNGFKIKAKRVVLACHYPFELIPFFLPVRTFIEKSYIMAKSSEIIKNETFITTYPDIVSKRFYTDYEITLTGSHVICNHLNVKKNFKKLTKKDTPEFLWSNEDIMTADYLPFVGKIEKNLFLMTGYNTWGMITSRIAALLIKDLLLGKENIYQKAFDPYRKLNTLKLKQYPVNIVSNMKGFLENKIYKKKKWYPSNLEFSMRNGKSIAKYTNEKEEEFLVYTTCPHMGCTLTFNEIEKTWDCPCHASRFDLKGKCIKGPSVKDITYPSSLK